MTKFLAVLGHPITHSLSPVLHRAAYQSLGLDWTYDAIDVTDSQLASFIGELDSDWVGLSLTMPLKQTVLELLDERTATVVATGAANTVVFDRAGGNRRLLGANTDVAGIIVALGEADGPWLRRHEAIELAQVQFQTGEGIDLATDGRGHAPLPVVGDGPGLAVIIGAGATAASALAALARCGVTEVHVVVRSLARVAVTDAAARALGVSVQYHLRDDLDALLRRAQVVVSTLPSRAADSYFLDRESVDIPEDAVLLDVAYEERPTVFGWVWQHSGGRYVSGERMLLHQAVEQVALFTGRRPDVAMMDQALIAAL